MEIYITGIHGNVTSNQKHKQEEDNQKLVYEIVCESYYFYGNQKFNLLPSTELRSGESVPAPFLLMEILKSSDNTRIKLCVFVFYNF